MYEREGGLMLCACGHPMSWHPQQPEYFTHAGSSALALASVKLMPPQCVFCDCTTPCLGEFQGLRLRESEHSLKGK